MINKVINKIKKRTLNKHWHDVNYVLEHRNQFTADFLEKHKNVVEIEHQLGRYFNMKKVIDEIKQKKLSGDVVEFGTWQGLGLVYLSTLFNDDKSEMKFIGIDSFEGLPDTSTVWKKGDFNNTSIELAKQNFMKYGNGGVPKENLYLLKGWFNDIKVREQLEALTKDVVLIHFDADLGSSTTQALAMIEGLLANRSKPIYFLFDDWGVHPDEVPDAFFEWVEKSKDKLNFKLTKLYSTRCTRYCRLDF